MAGWLSGWLLAACLAGFVEGWLGGRVATVPLAAGGAAAPGIDGSLLEMAPGEVRGEAPTLLLLHWRAHGGRAVVVACGESAKPRPAQVLHCGCCCWDSVRNRFGEVTPRRWRRPSAMRCYYQ